MYAVTGSAHDVWYSTDASWAKAALRRAALGDGYYVVCTRCDVVVWAPCLLHRDTRRRRAHRALRRLLAETLA